MQEELNSFSKEELLEEIEKLKPYMTDRARRMRETPQIEKAAELAEMIAVAHRSGEPESI
jgi:hypothetical protein